jgi:NADPH:quinone reductase-like Zn-dependent oxidoreductase
LPTPSPSLPVAAGHPGPAFWPCLSLTREPFTRHNWVMQAVWITKYGPPSVLAVRETPDPTPGPGEVRIRVRAAGLNFAEVTARKGLYPDAPKPPCVVGYEGAGVVDALGEGVTGLAAGTRVMFLSRFGGQSDVVCVPAVAVIPIPAALGFVEAAAIPVNYLTAYQMLYQVGRVRAGDHVLVHMAAGGVGTAVLQLCRAIGGVTTYGTCSASKHEFARSQGCDHCIDYRSSDYVAEVKRLTGDRGVHYVLDALGPRDWKKGYSLLRAGGMLITFGIANVSTGPSRNLFKVAAELLRTPRYSPLTLLNENRAVAGVNMGHMWHEAESMREAMIELVRMWENKQIHPHVHAALPFAKAAEAHALLEQGKNVGKVVLTP